VPAGMHYDATTKECLNDTDLCPNLPGAQTTIPEGYEYDATLGKCILECPAGQHWDEQLQKCVPDDHNCPAGTTWDPVKQLCVSICTLPEVYNPQTGRCEDNQCPNGTHRMPDGSCQSDGSDVCPNIPDTQLVVPVGYHKDASGNCVPDNPGGCPPGQHWDVDQNKCVNDNCPAGQHWDVAQGKCVPDVHFCPQYTHWDETVQTCLPDTECDDGSTCVSTTPNKCGLFDGITVCTQAGPRCIPLDPKEQCTICPTDKKLLKRVKVW